MAEYRIVYKVRFIGRCMFPTAVSFLSDSTMKISNLAFLAFSPFMLLEMVGATPVTLSVQEDCTLPTQATSIVARAALCEGF